MNSELILQAVAYTIGLLKLRKLHKHTLCTLVYSNKDHLTYEKWFCKYLMQLVWQIR